MKILPELQKDRLIRLIDEIADYSIILLDIDGKVEHWNDGAQRIKGYCADEIIGQNFRRFYTEEDRKNGKPDRLIETATKSGSAQDEGWRVRKDGTRFWGSVTINAIHGDDGEIVGFGKVTRDLTAQREAEIARVQRIEELKNKNRELAQFTYIASHDLQEPLRTLISFTDLINEEYGENLDSDLRSYFEFIQESSARMRDLVRGLLEYSRIGKESELTEVDCAALAKNILSDMQLLIKEKKAEIKLTDLPVVTAYEVELRQLFQNLLSNALKFTTKETIPKVEISAVDNDDNWIFSVKDNGIGIEEKFFDKIFVIFQRLHARADYEGTGIGLSHCKKIVELHGGSIWVESVPGSGSVFSFTIPKIKL